MTTAPHQQHDGVLWAVQTLLGIMVIVLFITTFLVQPFRIPSESMEPTLNVGDFLLVDKQSYSPRIWLDALLPPSPVHRGDIIVFHYPVNPAIHVVKRVIALPGDRLRLHAGRVILNGQPLAEPYAFYAPTLPDAYRDNFPAPHALDASVDPDWFRTLRRDVRDGELYIPPGHFFVLGDNRNDSEDSRYWGFVSQQQIVGRPLLVYLTVNPHTAATPTQNRFATWLHSIRIIR